MSTQESLAGTQPPEPETAGLRTATDSPEYSIEPTAGETSLGTSSAIRADTARRTFLVRQDDITLTFAHQFEDVPIPRYGRAGCISGQIHLASTYGVTAVSVQLEGKIVIDLEGRVPMFTFHFLKIPLSLWEKRTSGEKAPPFAMPFRFDLPETFVNDEGEEHPLPPSYEPEMECANLKDLHVQSSYTVTVKMARSRFMPNKLMVQKLNYDPRTVPPLHTLIYPFPYLTLANETVPQGWKRYDEVVVARPRTGLSDVQCQLYAPDLRVYAIKGGPIPYFLRMHGRLDSISALLCHSAPPSPSSSRSSRSRWATNDVLRPATYDIDVHVERQVSIAVGGFSAVRSYIIGKCTLRDVPPVYRLDGEESTVDYEGEIQIEPTVAAGGFNVRKLSIADFFVFSIKASDPHEAAFDDLTHSHSIRLVTG